MVLLAQAGRGLGAGPKAPGRAIGRGDLSFRVRVAICVRVDSVADPDLVRRVARVGLDSAGRRSAAPTRVGPGCAARDTDPDPALRGVGQIGKMVRATIGAIGASPRRVIETTKTHNFE